jgi:hypothetical protein
VQIECVGRSYRRGIRSYHFGATGRRH